ncbi:MAG: hypothetical protein ABI605_05255 [Rhizobacter sp.]
MTFAFKKLIPALACAALMAGNVAWAEHSVTPDEAVPLPEQQMSGSVAYVTGGIPFEQIPAFVSARRAYALNIEVYEKAGTKNEFTADAQVKLFDRSGNVVLEAKTEGPYLWAKVPPGQYRLQTTLNGRMQEQRVAISTGAATRAIVVFPQMTD